MNKLELEDKLLSETDSTFKKKRKAGRALKITSLVVDNTDAKVSKETLKFISEKVKQADIEAYILWLGSRKKGDNSFNDFLNKRSLHKNSKTVIVADFSNLTIGNFESKRLLDLKGANFTGSIFHNTSFIGCDLKNAKFCATHLEKVVFKESSISFVDFRRSDLSSCVFDKSYCLATWNSIEGIKFSSTISCLKVYADVKNEIAKKNEQQRLLDNKRMQLEEVKKRTPFFTKIGVVLAREESGGEYSKIRNEYRQMRKGIFHHNHIIHNSLRNILKEESFVFDPIFLPGEEYGNSKIRKKYITLSRDHLVQYLKRIKRTKNLSLNDFAKELYMSSIPVGTKHDSELQIIADLSSKVNMFGNNEWNRLDLSELNFANADLSCSNFAGSNLKNCNFEGANITNASFECALLTEGIFINTMAMNSNFFNADITDSSLKKSDFTGAIFSRSKCSNSRLSDIKMDFLKANHSVWKLAKLERVSLNCSDFTAADFRGGEFLRVQAKDVLFNDSLLNNTRFEGCIFDKSLFDRAVAIHTIWDNCLANEIEARRSNFTGSKFAEGSKFEKADFSYSIFDGVKAPRGRFTGSILNHVKAGYAKFADSCFEGASFKFVDLNNCVMNQSNCQKADFTGAKLFNVTMTRANLKDSSIVGGEVKDSDFTRVSFEDSNWRDLHIKDSVLNNINNHRIRTNDNTEIIDCTYKVLDGQFYHYDEDNFMDIMFIEQFESNLKRVANAEMVRKLGILAFVFRLFSKKYNVPSKEVKRLYNYKLHNKNELKKYLKKLLLEESHGQDARLVKIKNFHNGNLS
jgi:uncharacterized protein YjbI with pentapeptide repeats